MKWLDTEAYRRFEQARYTAQVFAALASPVRVRLVELLADGAEWTTGDLVSRVNVPTPDDPGVIYNVEVFTARSVGRHLEVLRQARVVEAGRRGRQTVYRLLVPWAVEACQQAEEFNLARTAPGSSWGSGARHPRPAEPGAAADGVG